MKYLACAATMQGVWFSHDGGDKWKRLPTPVGGMYNEARCWAVETHPALPGEILAGTDQGLYRYTPASGHFAYVPSPMDDLHILRIARHPLDPDFIVCGTRPGELFLSTDNGATWERADLRAATECWFINTTRITSIHFDPADADTLWVTIEIDGVFRSRDRGRTWTRLVAGLQDCDTHDLVFHGDPGEARILLCSTEAGLHRSVNEGDGWEPVAVPEAPWPYWRSIKARAGDTRRVFASIGDKPSGEAAVLLRSDDAGEQWQRVPLPAEPNSTIWSIATHGADPDLLFFATIFGQIFRSRDGGDHWEKIERELGEIRMIAWTPLPA